MSYGPFELGDLDDGAVEEVETEELRAQLGPALAKQANADFDAPLTSDDARIQSSRRSEARPQGREPGPHNAGRRYQNKAEVSGPHPGVRDRNDRKKKHRRDRSGGPRPSRPRPK